MNMKFMGFDWYTYISNSVGTIWENEDPNGNSTNGGLPMLGFSFWYPQDLQVPRQNQQLVHGLRAKDGQSDLPGDNDWMEANHDPQDPCMVYMLTLGVY